VQCRVTKLSPKKIDIADKKQQLRVELLAKRRELDKNFIAIQSKKMSEKLFEWPHYQQAKVIMLFLSMPDEPQMMNMIQHAWEHGKTVCVPHMRQKFGVMDAARIDTMNSLIRGRFNLLVPDPAHLQLVDPKVIDVMAVPAVAYDSAGNRLGMGAGYYDRFIPQAMQAIRIGVVWSSHIIKSIPSTEHDKPVHYLLDETKITQIPF